MSSARSTRTSEGTGGRQPPRCREPDTGRATGYHRDLALERESGRSSLSPATLTCAPPRSCRRSVVAAPPTLLAMRAVIVEAGTVIVQRTPRPGSRSGRASRQGPGRRPERRRPAPAGRRLSRAAGLASRHSGPRARRRRGGDRSRSTSVSPSAIASWRWSVAEHRPSWRSCRSERRFRCPRRSRRSKPAGSPRHSPSPTTPCSPSAGSGRVSASS